jgi:hypothetical protein
LKKDWNRNCLTSIAQLNKFFIRGFVSGTAAAGGVGKTALLDVEICSLALGRDLLDDGASIRCGPRKILVLSLEDDKTESLRRYRAIAAEYGFTPADLAKLRRNVHFIFDAGGHLKVVRATAGGAEVDQDLVRALISRIRKIEADVLVLDPLISAHSVDENDNGAMQKVLACLRFIARATDSAVHFAHHFRKAGNGSDSDMRGASSLREGCRAIRTLRRVAADEAVKLGASEKEAPRLILSHCGKMNLAPQGHEPEIFITLPQPLHNATVEFDGDVVGVVRRWTPPGLFSGLSRELCFEAHSLPDRLPVDQRRKDPGATGWIGYALAELFGLDAVSDKRRVTAIIDAFLKAKTWSSGPKYCPVAKRSVPVVERVHQQENEGENDPHQNRGGAA